MSAVTPTVEFGVYTYPDENGRVRVGLAFSSGREKRKSIGLEINTKTMNVKYIVTHNGKKVLGTNSKTKAQKVYDNL